MVQETREVRSTLSSYIPIIFLFILAFSLLPSCTKQQRIVHDLDEREANEILVFLARNGISAEKAAQESGGGGGQGAVKYAVVVTSTDTTEAMALLNLHGLPRKRNPDLLSLFSQGGLVPSELEEKVKYEEGLSEKIAGMIRRVDGVLDAVVQISFPAEDTLNPDAPKKDKTASVYVKHQGVLDDPNSQLVTKIKRLVSSSVEGLKFEKVTVIPDRARFLGTPEGMSAKQLEERKDYRRVWGVILAVESVRRFQVLFLSFCTIITLLLVSLLWTLFRFYPVLARTGGPKQLLSMQPITFSHEEEGEAEEEKPEEGSAEEEEGDEDEEQKEET